MVLRERIFRIIREIDDDSVDRAMAAALPTADTHDMRLLGIALLERNHPEGTIGLIQHFHGLPADLQQTIVDQVTELYRPLREAAGHRQTSDPFNVIEIVRRSRATRLTYLVGDQLVHGSEVQRKTAAECLLDLAQWRSHDKAPSASKTHSPRQDAQAPRDHRSSDAPGPLAFDAAKCDALSASYLQSTIEEAVCVYESHRRQEVLRAMAALAPRALPVAIKHLSAGTPGRSKAVDALRVMVHRADTPEICRAMFLLIALPTLSNDVRIGLKHALRGPHLQQVLTGAHLLLNQNTAQELHRLTEIRDDLPTRDDAMALPRRRQRALPWLLAALTLPPLELVEHLSNLSDLSDRMARLAVLRRLMKLTGNEWAFGADDAISRFCFDSDPTLACVALRHLIRINWPRLPQMLPRLVNAGSENVRQIAVARLAPIAFERFWKSWPSLDQRQRVSAGKALIKIDPNFHRNLARHLVEPKRTSQLRALAIVHTLNQGGLFEQALIALTKIEDSKVVASAVRALATVRSPRAIEVLETALEHPDSRVRANAVEALQQTDATRHVERLVEMSQHEDNRPRANAIGALLEMRTADALAALKSMLADTRANHRTSALWLVEAMGLVQMATQVAEMSIKDPDREVQKRADDLIHDLIELMGAAPPQGGMQPRVSAMMQSLAMTFVLAGDDVQWRLREISEHWGSRGGHVISMGWFFAALGSLTALVGGLWLRNWYRRRQVSPGPMPIFRRIARSAGLGASERRLLIRIAQRAQLTSPLTLMCSGATLDHYAKPYIGSLPHMLRAPAAERLTVIRQGLFEP